MATTVTEYWGGGHWRAGQWIRRRFHVTVDHARDVRCALGFLKREHPLIPRWRICRRRIPRNIRRPPGIVVVDVYYTPDGLMPPGGVPRV